MHQELTEALALMEELKRQESRARADWNEAEVLAEKRLEELSLSQQKCHTLHCINGQLEEEVREQQRKGKRERGGKVHVDNSNNPNEKCASQWGRILTT